MGRKRHEARWLTWKERVQEQRRSGLSIAAFCRQEGVSAPSFYVWRKRLGEAAEPASRRRGVGDRRSRASSPVRQGRGKSRLFVPVRLAPERELTHNVRIKLPGGAVVSLPSDAPVELVTAAIRAAMPSAAAEPSSC